MEEEVAELAPQESSEEEHVYNNEDGSLDLAPELNVDENTILLPVACENGLTDDDPAIAFSATDYLQEEEEVVDPMDTSAHEEEQEENSAKRVKRKTVDAPRTPTQVPKKRRHAVPIKFEPEDDPPAEKVLKRRGRKPGSKVVNGQVLYPTDKGYLSDLKSPPKAKDTKSPKSAKVPKTMKVEDTGGVNESQCRVCMSTDDLVSVFKKEHTKSYAEKLVALCPTVNIQRKDFLPQFVCRVCASSVNAAFALKTQCEQTDIELRDRLEKSLTKVRRPASTKYVEPESEPEEFPDPVRDQDFKLSDASPASADDSDSDYGKPLAKRRTRRSHERRRSRKALSASSPVATTSKAVTKAPRKSNSTSPKKKIKTEPQPKAEPDLNATKSSEDNPEAAAGDFSSGSEENYSPPKIKGKRGRKPKPPGDGLTCRSCKETLPTREELKAHRKAMHSHHVCELCGRKFRVQSSLKAHMEKHTNSGELKCELCEKYFANKTERRKHMVEVHKQSPAQFTCEKCKRAFTSEVRLQKHNESRCPGFDVTQNKKRVDIESLSMGKDLFKCVAPLTTTYWSDSFSD